jgi:hypothetical protein
VISLGKTGIFTFISDDGSLKKGDQPMIGLHFPCGLDGIRSAYACPASLKRNLIK